MKIHGFSEKITKNYGRGKDGKLYGRKSKGFGSVYEEEEKRIVLEI